MEKTLAAIDNLVQRELAGLGTSSAETRKYVTEIVPERCLELLRADGRNVENVSSNTLEVYFNEAMVI